MAPNIFSRLRGLDAPTVVEKSKDAVRIGILGAARIAPQSLISPAAGLSQVLIAAVAARDIKRAEEYAVKHSIPKAYGSYEELLNDTEIEAIYNPLPNALHYEWTIKALQAGKHVFLEKPAASNGEEAQRILEELQQHPELVILENFHYQFHPALLRFRELVNDGRLGQIKNVSAIIRLPNLFGLDDIRFNYDLAGGINMDLGCYAVSALRFITNTEPLRVLEAEPTIVKENVEGEMKAKLEFPEGITGEIHVSMIESWLSFRNFLPLLTVEGEQGEASISAFVLPHMFHTITLKNKRTGETEYEKVYEEGRSSYQYSLKAFADKVRGKATDYWYPFDKSVGNAVSVDRIYEGANMKLRGKPLNQSNN
ncbi:NAD(P)-binding protein [Basidiobolus meristosporus CBS 931.73]|uniref:D-xylose 1-dehydrogenase (NADP(+), D-xylono-1,5-lactone-forming) n=1 Tax=Basidiobolus meristosporus CBS 931.73 TaxID=1314790 RepID=A0A1Y1Z0U7_9FUNG|nr:NAD(P)-binding protein [Basidiobolus meristosporus CBS 931.73]|eukprot:ORY03806.1 NAD(P)-binding protein [Basidiobolus meristosporus CBS 931.73]